MTAKAPTKPDAAGVSIAEFVAAIQLLPEDMPNGRTDVWYRTQKEHWLGWLGQYDGPGAYGRTQSGRDAKFSYNHIVNPFMLLWLVEAAGLPAGTVEAARDAAKAGSTLMQKAGAVRKQVPWADVARALWPVPAVA